jgi:hypothetical protein
MKWVYIIITPFIQLLPLRFAPNGTSAVIWLSICIISGVVVFAYRKRLAPNIKEMALGYSYGTILSAIWISCFIFVGMHAMCV